MGTKRKERAVADLKPAEVKRLRQRQLVLFFQTVFLIIAALSLLFPWYTVHYGSVLISTMDGVERPEGKVFMASAVLGLFFASFNLLYQEELDWPLLIIACLLLASLGWFYHEIWSNKKVFEDIVGLAEFEGAVRSGGGGIGAKLRLTAAPALWTSLVSAINLISSGVYLVFVQPARVQS